MTWAAIGLIGVATFALRSSFLLVFTRPLPAGVAKALRFLPASILPALIASGVLSGGAHGVGAGTPERALAALLAALLAYLTRSVALTMLGGMAALWGLQALLAL